MCMDHACCNGRSLLTDNVQLSVGAGRTGSDV